MCASFEKGRDHEIQELVRAKRAALVDQLPLGQLNGRLPSISETDFQDWTRAQLKRKRDRIRAEVKGESGAFCSRNFDGLTEARLAELYIRVFDRRSKLQLPLIDFIRQFGRPKPGVLRGAPLHATVCISPWGLQTEYPEDHMCKDLAEAFNSTLTIQREFDRAEAARWNRPRR